MKTAKEVLEFIDSEINDLERLAAGPCVDALIEWQDREAYREATKRAYSLKAIQSLREKLASEIEANGTTKARKKRAS